MILFLAVILFHVFCTLGVDISETCNNFSCLKSSGYTFAIVRCYRSTGTVDTECANSVKNAWNAGLSDVDVYMFPCPKCDNPGNQVNELMEYLKNNGVKYGQIWLDIEGSEYWESETYNHQFFEYLIGNLTKVGASIGVYTSDSQWNPIMGSSYTYGKNYPLWYAHYDGSQSFSDFTSFGGWTSPAMKQFEGDKTLCGCGVDENWY